MTESNNPDDFSDLAQALFGQQPDTEPDTPAEPTAGNTVPSEGGNPSTSKPNTDRQFLTDLFN